MNVESMCDRTSVFIYLSAVSSPTFNILKIKSENIYMNDWVYKYELF